MIALFCSARALTLTLVLLLVLSPSGGLAFGTVNVGEQSAEHEKITRIALGPLGFQTKSLNEIAGKRFKFGAVGAPDRRVVLIKFAPAHCDGADHLAISGYPQSRSDARKALLRCKAWINQNMDKAVTAAGRLVNSRGRIQNGEIPTVVACSYNGRGGRAKCEVFEALGLVLHASQDFYAHSNWTDERSIGGRTITRPPALGNTSPALFIKAGSRVGPPAGVITGCFKFIPERIFCSDRIKHEVLNKDKGPINVSARTVGEGTTPRARRNKNFQRAARAAVADTRIQWGVFEARVRARYGTSRGNKIICAMKRDNPARTC